MSAERRAVGKKKWAHASKPANDASNMLVQEILSASLASRTYKAPAKEPEWKCTNCDTSNFATRFKCRDYLKPQQTGRASNPANPPSAAKSKGKGKGTGSPTVKPKPTATDDENQEKGMGKEASKVNP